MKGVEHVFLDLDGTLIGGAGEVTQRVLTSAARARSAGIGLSVCTGRPWAGVARRTASLLHDAGLHIFESGAMIVSSDGPVHVEALPVSVLDRLVEISRETDAVLELYTEDGIFVSRLDEKCQWHARVLDIEVREEPLGRVVEERQVVRAHWIMQGDQVQLVTSRPVPDCEMGVATSPVMPGVTFASVTATGVSKGSAVTRVADLLGFSLTNAAGVGDSEGDRSMLEVVGHPYVMANAPTSMSQDFPVIPSVEEDGVAVLFDAQWN